jgi:thioesterase domain-containing protein
VADPTELEAYLHEHIPVSRHLGVQALEAGFEGVALHAPLAPNLNHRRTAFGGSISALAILAGWSLLWVRLRGLTAGHQIVIHDNTITYTAPVRADFQATSVAPDGRTWEQFVRTFRSRGRARIEIDVRVESGGETVAEFRGRYVVLAGNGGSDDPSLV